MIYETHEWPYSLLVLLNTGGTPLGNAYIDDGASYPPGSSRRILNFSTYNRELDIERTGAYFIHQTGDDHYSRCPAGGNDEAEW